MAFIGSVDKGTTYAPGYFIANGDENVTRETREIAQDGAIDVDGTKHQPMGKAYPSNDSNAIGLLYEDVDVTVGDMPGSVVTANATVYEDRLPATLSADAKTALAARGFKFIATAPAVDRPY